MNYSHRTISRAAGIFYLLTFVSIPTLAIYGPVKSVGYILNNGPDTSAIVGGVLEIIVALACIATAVVLFPILKKQNETLALGLVASRVLEAATIFLGVAFLLTVVSLRQTEAGDIALPVSQALVTLYDRIFLLGQSLLPAINDILLGVLLYQSRLVPRSISVIGVIGGSLLLLGWFAVMFGFVPQRDTLAGLSALGVALFEFSLGIWLVVKGFNVTAVTALESKK
jgi:hypothetical protein